MGGRGSSSNLLSVSAEQQRLMNNLKKRNASRPEYSQPTFKKNKDGSVYYEYTYTTIVHREHGGKMISPEKADIYERTEHYSGLIMPDGLRNPNKKTYEDKLIKKGRLPRRRK